MRLEGTQLCLQRLCLDLQETAREREDLATQKAYEGVCLTKPKASDSRKRNCISVRGPKEPEDQILSFLLSQYSKGVR